MIPAAKQPLFNAVFARYVRGRLRGTFQAVRVQDLELLGSALAAGPVMVVSNHTAWFDSLVLIWLSNFPFHDFADSDGYALMDARNLRRMPFFRRLGVFGVDLDDAEDRAAVLDYGASLLTEPGDQVWIFPQGAERPVTERPLGFHRGAAVIAARAGVPVVPAALRYEHGRHDKPVAYVAFGEPLTPTGDEAADVAAQEQAVEALLADLEAEVQRAARRQDTIPVVLPGRRPLLGVIAERTLSVMLQGVDRIRRLGGRRS